MTSHLTVVDVCDAHCPAAAQVKLTDEQGRELMFCAHDYGKHEVKLAVDGWTVFSDTRESLVKRPADVSGGIA